MGVSVGAPGVDVRVGVGDAVAVLVLVGVDVRVAVRLGVAVTVDVGVFPRVGVLVIVAVRVEVRVAVAVAVTVLVWDLVGVRGAVEVAVAEGVIVGDAVAVGVRPVSCTPSAGVDVAAGVSREPRCLKASHSTGKPNRRNARRSSRARKRTT